MNGTTRDMAGHKDYVGSKVGMWLFLASEILLFAGPFLLFVAYRYRYIAGFGAASLDLDIVLGTTNTMVLLTSSLTMALAIRAVRAGREQRSVLFILATVFLGLVFLFIKSIEWSAKISHGIYPGSPDLLLGLGGESIFFGLYFFMAGIHALHVLAGVILLIAVALMVRDGRIKREDPVRIENSGLYWHLVDVIWIYIYQIFYIIG